MVYAGHFSQCCDRAKNVLSFDGHHVTVAPSVLFPNSNKLKMALKVSELIFSRKIKFNKGFTITENLLCYTVKSNF